MNCKHYQREIEHLDSVHTMSANAAKHIEICTDCSDFKRKHDSLQMLIGNLGRVAAPANFDAKLRARLHQSKTQTRGALPVWLNLSLLRPAIGVGFALILLVGGLVFVRPMFMNDGKTLGEVAISGFQIQEVKPVINKEESVAVPATTVPNDHVAINVSEPPQRKPVLLRNRANERSIGHDTDNKGAGVTTDTIIMNSEAISVPLRANTSSPYVILNDRKIPVRSVSFGSPTFLDGRMRQVTYSSDAEGIW